MSVLWKRGGVAAVLAIVLLALPFASGAGAAEWRTVPTPGGQILSISVASATTWLVERPSACCTRSFDLTEDGGASWDPAQISGFTDTILAGAAADGSFRVLGLRNFGAENQEIQVFRIGSGGAVDPLGPIIVGRTPLLEVAAVSDGGETWVPHWNPVQSAFELTIVAADGAVVTRALPDSSGTYGWEARRTVLGMRLLRFVPSPVVTDVYAGPTYRIDSGGDVLPAEGYPVSLADGELLVSANIGRASWDGGAHWSEIFFRPVPRAADSNEMPRYVSFSGGIVAERYSPSLFRGTGLVWPPGVATNFVVDAGTALVAWRESTDLRPRHSPAGGAWRDWRPAAGHAADAGAGRPVPSRRGTPTPDRRRDPQHGGPEPLHLHRAPSERGRRKRARRAAGARRVHRRLPLGPLRSGGNELQFGGHVRPGSGRPRGGLAGDDLPPPAARIA